MNKNLPRQHILIVDDSPINVKILEAILEPYYNISVSTDGAESIEIAFSRAGQPDAIDLILLDITMPDIDGYEVCRILKADYRTCEIPIIFITARVEEKEEAKGFELGAIDYIRKPLSAAVVRARVKNHLDLKAHRDNLERLNTVLKQEITERERTEEALKYLLKKQEVDINLAKKILNMVNGDIPRYIGLSEGLTLFVDMISVPCYMEGGDHYFVRSFPFCISRQDKKNKYKKTLISLKDQSGHEVVCVLKAIITDIIHNNILNNAYSDGSFSIEKTISVLNDKICDSDAFRKEDFFTLINAEIDHETLMLKYVSAGHPPFLLIRGNKVMTIPNPGEDGANIPIALVKKISYSAGNIQLQEGDKLVFYTDGLTEMPIRNLNKTISSDELKEIVNQIISRENGICVSDIMQKILDTITEISGETVIPASNKNPSKNTSDDDITLLCLEIENENNYKESVWNPKSCHISEFISKLSEEIGKEWKDKGYDSLKIPTFRLILEEAILNAWEHGNKKNPEKSLIIRYRYGNDFNLEIIDQGQGFDYENIPDPTSDENLTKPSGRGIFIIRHFSNGLRWKNQGRHMIMSFKKIKN